MDDKIKVSTRAQFLINSLIANAAAANSEFPIKAMRAKSRMEEIKKELHEHIGRLEEIERLET